MGVDYTAKFGIGYKISDKVFEDDNCMDEYLGEICDDRFDYFETGSSNYGGEANEWYLCLKYPFNDTLDLTYQKLMLDNFIQENNLEPISEFDIQGGLLIW